MIVSNDAEGGLIVLVFYFQANPAFFECAKMRRDEEDVDRKETGSPGELRIASFGIGEESPAREEGATCAWLVVGITGAWSHHPRRLDC